MRQAILQLLECVGANGSALATENNVAHRPIQAWNFCFGQSPGDFFRQPQPRHSASLAVALLDVVVDLYFAIPDLYPVWQSLEALTNLSRNELITIDYETRRAEIIHRSYVG